MLLSSNVSVPGGNKVFLRGTQLGEGHGSACWELLAWAAHPRPSVGPSVYPPLQPKSLLSEFPGPGKEFLK